MPTGRTLNGRRILVVEDEYLLADELRMELADAGAVVLGPVGTVGAAVDLIRTEPRIDGAILDLNLRGEMALPAADLLIERGVPFVFTTGYDQSFIPKRFSGIALCEKPANVEQLAGVLGRQIRG